MLIFSTWTCGQDIFEHVCRLMIIQFLKVISTHCAAVLKLGSRLYTCFVCGMQNIFTTLFTKWVNKIVVRNFSLIYLDCDSIFVYTVDVNDKILTNIWECTILDIILIFYNMLIFVAQWGNKNSNVEVVFLMILREIFSIFSWAGNLWNLWYV
jgi:hypothetical protein